MILDAATREFAERGWAGATTAGVARRAKVTQPLIHHHFGSKRGLWLAVLETLFEDLQARLMSTVEASEGKDRRSRLESLLRAFVQFSGERPELSRLIRAESSAGGAPFEDIYNSWMAQWIAFFEFELKEAVREKVVKPIDVRLLYFSIVGACSAPFAEPLTARRAFGIDTSKAEFIKAYADTLVTTVFQGVGLS